MSGLDRIIITVFLGLWYASGVGSALFWNYHSSHKITLGDAAFSLVTGIVGPVNFLFGATVYGDDIVLWRKKP